MQFVKIGGFVKSTLRSLFMLGLCLQLSTIGCGAIGGKPQGAAAVEGVGQIAEEKSRCEQRASILKAIRKADSSDYREAANRYYDAKAAFDGWLQQVRFDLVAGADSSRADRYKSSVDDVAKKCSLFVQYVSEIRGSEQQLPARDREVVTRDREAVATRGLESVAMSVAQGLFNGMKEVWKEYQTAQKAKRDEILKTFDELKWQRLEEISAAQ
jgi:hypothetical protein